MEPTETGEEAWRPALLAQALETSGEQQWREEDYDNLTFDDFT
jgi:hypothetical protein